MKTNIPSGIFTMPSAYEILITPTSHGDQGDYLLELELSDGNLISGTYKTKVSIINEAPLFTADPPQDLSIHFNETFYYKIPSYIDPEGLPVKITLEAIPAGKI